MKFMCLLSILIIVTQPDFAKELKSWKDVLQDNTFRHFLTFVVETKRLDIVSPNQCLVDNREVMQQFLKGLPFAARFISQYAGHYSTRTCDEIQFQASSILVILCKSKSEEVLEPQVYRPYINTIVVAPEELISIALSDIRRRFVKGFLKHLISDVYAVITAVNGTLMLTKGIRRECLTCRDSPLTVGKAPLLLRQVALRGKHFTAHCLTEESCLHPSYVTLCEVLKHKGGRIYFDNGPYLAVVNSVHKMQTRVLFHGVKSVRRYPRNVLVDYHHPYDKLAFCRRRRPIPKEAVLLLPFTWEVWLTFFSALFMSTFSLFLIFRITVGKAARLNTIAFSVVSVLLYQSGQLPCSFRNRISTRVIVGLWGFMSLVIATGFKGSLTALLRYVPMEGEIPHGTSMEDLLVNGYKVCLIDDPKYTHPWIRRGFVVNSNYEEMIKSCVTPANKKAIDDGTLKVILLTPSLLSPNSKRITQVVHGMGEYVPLRPSQNMSYTTMLATSPYRKAVASTLARARETGLFDSVQKLKEFEINHVMWDDTVATEPEVLLVKDVKPYFLALCSGLVAASLVLLFEVYAVSRPLCLKMRPWKRFLWMKPIFCQS